MRINWRYGKVIRDDLNAIVKDHLKNESFLLRAPGHDPYGYKYKNFTHMFNQHCAVKLRIESNKLHILLLNFSFNLKFLLHEENSNLIITNDGITGSPYFSVRFVE